MGQDDLADGMGKWTDEGPIDFELPIRDFVGGADPDIYPNGGTAVWLRVHCQAPGDLAIAGLPKRSPKGSGNLPERDMEFPDLSDGPQGDLSPFLFLQKTEPGFGDFEDVVDGHSGREGLALAQDTVRKGPEPKEGTHKTQLIKVEPAHSFPGGLGRGGYFDAVHLPQAPIRQEPVQRRVSLLMFHAKYPLFLKNREGGRSGI